MAELSFAQRRALRARAHALKPIVMIRAKDLAPEVIAEVERRLLAHELIKIRVAGAERNERETLLASICAQTGALPVQHIGKILVVYRQQPESPPPSRRRTCREL